MSTTDTSPGPWVVRTWTPYIKLNVVILVDFGNVFLIYDFFWAPTFPRSCSSKTSQRNLAFVHLLPGNARGTVKLFFNNYAWRFEDYSRATLTIEVVHQFRWECLVPKPSQMGLATLPSVGWPIDRLRSKLGIHHPLQARLSMGG